jgi:hypothetical protein
MTFFVNVAISFFELYKASFDTLYDGLRQYHSVASILQKQQAHHPRPGYRQTHALFYRSKISA